MDRFWSEAFKAVLGRAERSLVSNCSMSATSSRTTRPSPTTTPSARSIPCVADGGDQRRRDAEQLGKMRDTILRTKFTELQRNEERRKTQRLEISVETVAGLLPWREVVEPHQDVATGEFQQAEFAADLAKVHSGSAPPEYRDPRQFFSRTYLTEGLSALLIGAAKRLSGSGGDPVVELQTNFGGGKTHSMLALYHMAGRRRSRTSPAWTSCSRSRGSACRRASIGPCSSARRGAAGRAPCRGRPEDPHDLG
jgi:hypothetical protein